MTDKEFCQLDTDYFGERITNIKQIGLRAFNGDELKDYVEHCIKLHLLNISSVSNCTCKYDCKNCGTKDVKPISMGSECCPKCYC